MKKNIYVAAVIVLLILILIFFIFEKNKRHQENSQVNKNIQKISTTTPTSIVATTTTVTTRATSTSVAKGWATYVNQKEGFSIDYPANFIVNDRGGDGPLSFSIDFGDKETIASGQGIIGIGILKIYKTFDEYLKNVQDPYRIDKKVKIDGSEAIFYSFTFSEQNNYDTRVVIKHDNKFWAISTNSFNEGFRKVPDGFTSGFADNLLSESDYDRVISSFKFLK